MCSVKENMSHLDCIKKRLVLRLLEFDQELWAVKPITLRVVDAQVTKGFEGFLIFDPFGDGGQAHDLTDLIDRFQHRSADRVLFHVAYEFAVDF